MLILIDKECRLISAEGVRRVDVPPVCEHRGNEGTTVFLSGDAFGGKYRGKICNQAHLVTLFTKHRGDPEEICSILKGTVGEFNLFLVQMGRVSIFSSPGGVGFYYTINGDRLIISDEMKVVLQHAHKELNEMEILKVLLWGFTSPFETVLESVRRIPGGQEVQVTKGPFVSNRSYLVKSKQDVQRNINPDNWATYKEFKAALDATCTIIAQRCKNPYLCLSGGVDSSTVLLSLVEAGATPRAITCSNPVDRTFWGQWDKSFSESMCQQIGVENIQVEADLTLLQLRELRDQVYERTILTFSDWPASIQLGIAHYLSNQNKDGACVISGETMDINYGISFTKSQLKWHALGAFPCEGLPRLFFTTAYHHACVGKYGSIGHQFANGFRKAFGSDLGLPSQIEHIHSMAMLERSQPFPVNSSSYFPVALSHILDEYRTYKVNSVVKRVLGGDVYAELVAGNMSGVYLNHLARAVRYYAHSAVTIGTLNEIGKIGNFQYCLPPSSGPLLDFFLSFHMSFPHVLWPKRFCHQYFRERMNSKPEDLVAKHQGLKPRFHRGILGEPKKRSANPLVPKSVYTQDILPALNKRHSLVLQLLPAGPVRDYLLNVLSNADALKPDSRMVRLYNLERLLRQTIG